ncbi:MAG TPA: hypothetical protein VE074_07225 [Jatrophihabitantaceae bacterium]|nr:hypothetical protein [Jatrophihabitantaceae bacterium]
MSEPDSGDGGFTGSAEGAPYSGYDPATDLQSHGDVPANPSGMTPEQLRHSEESDKPIEYDPWGQAIVGAVAGGVNVVAHGGETLIEEGVAFVASELGIGAAEHIAEGGSEGTEGSAGSGESDGDGGADGGAPDAGYDPNVEQQGAGGE